MCCRADVLEFVNNSEVTSSYKQASPDTPDKPSRNRDNLPAQRDVSMSAMILAIDKQNFDVWLLLRGFGSFRSSNHKWC